MCTTRLNRKLRFVQKLFALNYLAYSFENVYLKSAQSKEILLYTSKKQLNLKLNRDHKSHEYLISQDK